MLTEIPWGLWHISLLPLWMWWYLYSHQGGSGSELAESKQRWGKWSFQPMVSPWNTILVWGLANSGEGGCSGGKRADDTSRVCIVEAAASAEQGMHTVLASAFSHHPPDSESELSVSSFLSIASQSCEEDEGRDAPLLCHPSALRGPTRMSGEGNHGNQPAQYIGVKKHRCDTL